MRKKGGQEDGKWQVLWTVVKDVLLSFNFAAVLYKIYFLFRLLQPNESAKFNRIGEVVLTNILVLLTILHQ